MVSAGPLPWEKTSPDTELLALEAEMEGGFQELPLEAPDSGSEPGLRGRDRRSREGSRQWHQDQQGGWGA